MKWLKAIGISKGRTAIVTAFQEAGLDSPTSLFYCFNTEDEFKGLKKTLQLENNAWVMLQAGVHALS